VYDVTDWVKDHPGGAIIFNVKGKDATNWFEAAGHTTDWARNTMGNFLIGELPPNQKKHRFYLSLDSTIGTSDNF